MRTTLVSAGAIASALCALAAASPLPQAAAAGPTTVPMASNLRACDFTRAPSVSAVGFARSTGQVTVDGGRVTANVVLLTAPPGTYYDVRLIQTPRPSIGCGPGAPGVTTAGFVTDGVGNGGVSLVAPIAPGATGSWLIVERPGEYTQTPAEFYTSDFIVPS